MAKLSDTQLAERLSALAGWEIAAGQLVRLYHFPDFRGAMAFVNRVAGEAAARQHHPDIDIRYNKVLLALITHDAGGITEKDTEFAAAADGMA